MGNTYFKFKQFTIKQEYTAMKVGVDGVLLGAWANPADVGSILDVGTGTGLLALMLAQKSNASITAIEIEKEAFYQASKNFRKSKWSQQIEALHCSVQEYADGNNPKFELIICNPPYFNKSLPANNLQRNLARHDNRLPLAVLMNCVARLLSLDGCFYMIYPFDRKEEVLDESKRAGLFAKNLMTIKGTNRKEPNRFIVKLGFEKSDCVETSLIVRDAETNNYTDEYKKLTKDYYLKF